MVRDGKATEQTLRGILYRFDCPSPLTIGEYVLDLLTASARTELARHFLDCQLCEQELAATRAFMATEPVVAAPGLWHALRRVVATLLTPGDQPAYGMTRGSEPSSGSEYRAGPVKIVIGAVRGKRRGTMSIDGLILHDFAPSEALSDRDVSMFDSAQIKVHATRTDDLGSFAFEDVETGTYRLEVTLAEEVIVVDDVHVGS